MAGNVRFLRLTPDSEQDAQRILDSGYRLVGISQGVLVFYVCPTVDLADISFLETAIETLTRLRDKLPVAETSLDTELLSRVDSSQMTCASCKNFQQTGAYNKDSESAAGFCTRHQFSTSSSETCEDFAV